MEKNVAGKWVVFAYGDPDHSTLAGKAVTGDAANITANIRIDGGAANAVDDVNPTELEDGYYVFDITAAEANGDNLVLCPQSSTANVIVIGVPGAVWTRPANFNDMSITSSTGRVDLASVAGTAQTAGDLAALVTTVDTVVDGIQTDLDNGTDGLGAIKTAVDAIPTSNPTAAAIADAVWDELQADHVTAGSFGEVATEIASILADTNELQTDDVPGLIAALNNISTADVNTEVDNAIVTYGLDHLVSAAVTGTDVADNSIIAKLVSSSATADWDTFVNTDDSLQAISESGGGGPTAAAIADAVWDELQADHVTAGSFGEVATEIASILADTNELQTDDVPGLIAALNDPTAAAIADAVWDEAQADHVTAGSFGETATEIASILADTNELQTDDVPGLIAALNNISAAEVNTEVDNAIVTYGLDHLVAAAVTGTDVTDNSIIAKLVSSSATADWDTFVNTDDSLQAISESGGGGPTAAAIADAVWDELQADHVTAGSFGEVATEIASILADTNELQTDDVPGLIAALNNISTTDVKTQVVAALDTDTYAEPGQGTPGATISVTDKLGYLYQWARNKKDNNGTTTNYYADDGTTVAQKATTSKSGSTSTVDEMITGA